MSAFGVPGGLAIAAGAFAAGAVNAVAGGGSLISFPVLLAVGLPPVSANVTNTVAVLPGYLGGALGYRDEVKAQRRQVRDLVVPSVVGAVAGSIAILAGSPDTFEAIVPLLVLVASLLLAVQPVVQRWVRARPADGFARSTAALWVSTFLAAAYGAYFGGGLGVILLAVLGAFLVVDLQKVNALKSVLSLVINLVAAVAFAFFGPVVWWAVLVMAPMSIVGGWVGAAMARRLHPDVLRWSVVVFGVVVAVIIAVT